MGVMNVGMSMVGDLQRLQDISQELSVAIERPSVLPEKSIDYLAEACPLAAVTSDFQDSLSLGMSRSQISGSLTPQPVRSASSTSGLSRRSQSFDHIDDPANFYSEIPYTLQTTGQPVSPLTVSSTPPPPPLPVYNSAPAPPPPPVHKPSQSSLCKDEVYVYPEQPSPPPSAMTENGVPPPPVNASPGWRDDLMTKLRKRAESVGSPIRPSTPVEEQLYVEVEPPSFVLSQRSMSVSFPPPPVPNKVPQPMTPPTTHMRRSDSQVPPPKLPKPSRMSVASSYQDNSDNEDESPLAKALKGAKLKKTVSNDRSAPKV
ncbi:uncharacterized protein [Dysidea avara]|uniref:uncharacterized protein n=1 Tax=Dysidea avara TaxID=196820 RepID=UPI003326285E